MFETGAESFKTTGKELCIIILQTAAPRRDGHNYGIKI